MQGWGQRGGGQFVDQVVLEAKNEKEEEVEMKTYDAKYNNAGEYRAATIYHCSHH